MAISGELWIPRSMWEKRRQLSAVIHRGIMIGQRLLVLSCDDWTTFFGRIDISITQSTDALVRGQVEYRQLQTYCDARSNGEADLSRVLGRLGLDFEDWHADRAVVDDVDLLIDLSSRETAGASGFALIYALGNRFNDLALFSNPLIDPVKMNHLAQLEEFLTVHYPVSSTPPGSHQNVA